MLKAMSNRADYATERAALLEALGDNIRELREAKLPVLSQEEVAQKAVLHRTEWGMIEQGKREPRFSTLLTIAETLGVTLNDLAAGIDPPKERRPAPSTKKRQQPAS
jgi:transcriptional regulator with XRE-family HTH domain